MKTRPLYNSEISALSKYYAATMGVDQDEVRLNLQEWFTIVCENYITGCPGYAGNLYIVIPDGGPELFQLFGKHFSPIQQCDTVRNTEKD